MSYKDKEEEPTVTEVTFPYIVCPHCSTMIEEEVDKYNGVIRFVLLLLLKNDDEVPLFKDDEDDEVDLIGLENKFGFEIKILLLLLYKYV